MATATSIEWTETTWNPVRGCSRVSPGCMNCYAERMAHRFSGAGLPYEGLTRATSTGPRWTGQVRTVPELLREPLRWREPRLIFVNSMSDLFHEEVPLSFIRSVFEVMATAEHHRFQVLTKRADRLRELAPKLVWPANVWMGVSVESEQFTWRIDRLRETPAAVKFLSLEPLLSALPSLQLRGIDWAIVGGESGPGARPMQPTWVRAIRDQCQGAGVSFFFKQWGGVQKKASGRLLDGREHNEMPGGASDGHGVQVRRKKEGQRQLRVA
ncbi:MAG: phage Gp37/Gp68 family protein [Myxococcales bacterium]|nr:phage Gp37/Gp68 family protein [Myxococcales bacterium]